MNGPTDVPHFVATTRLPPAPPPTDDAGMLERWRRVYFGTPVTALITLALAALVIRFGWEAFDWGVLRAVFATGSAGPDACRADGAGACWAFVADKLRLMLFGLYPYDEQWRPAAAIGVLLLMYTASAVPVMWRWTLAVLWVLGLAAFFVLMHGGILGLSVVRDDLWGGLPVTLILATLGLAAGFPLAIGLALLRNSDRNGIGKALAIAFIEIVRAVPLLAVLFLASVMIPLFLPRGFELSKLFRVFVAFALFTAAYLAEVIRGGLQAVPKGQAEAAAALGLPRWLTIVKVILPQALAAVLPALVNVFIAFFKATSIVVVVGVFDLMTAANRATADAAWQGFGTEIYLFVALIYFVFCHAMSRYSRYLQARGGGTTQ